MNIGIGENVKRKNNMGHSNYKLSEEQKQELDIIAEEIIKEIESKLNGRIRDCLDPYNGREFDNNKFTAMLWYIGECIAYY
jgi:hypothetical protein